MISDKWFTYQTEALAKSRPVWASFARPVIEVFLAQLKGQVVLLAGASSSIGALLLPTDKPRAACQKVREL